MKKFFARDFFVCTPMDAVPTFSLFVVACVLTVSGCAGRKPVAAAPPSSQPSTLPPEAPEKPEPTARPVRPTPGRSPKSARAIPPIPGFTEEGNASWYGAPFHGRRSSNGEIYDMHKLTAAHRTLPFETVVRVTNLNNGKSTIVRITDRGPFVGNRIIDLSQAAAREIESTGSGVVPVRLEVISSGIDPASGFFTMQVGAFKDIKNAERLRARLKTSYPPVFVQKYDAPDGIYYRVLVGRVSGEDEARQFSEQLRAREGFAPLLIRLDENGISEDLK
ncbi:MAG TPA: septal ring lytic transglycosylase RlpA family protein [Candidatus Dormibacteraeota bacterium]|nr:septal ring lytic transglycosylase RlpA family protein [Candidatus Dormibacteraeota bacterium]